MKSDPRELLLNLDGSCFSIGSMHCVSRIARVIARLGIVAGDNMTWSRFGQFTALLEVAACTLSICVIVTVLSYTLDRYKIRDQISSISGLLNTIRRSRTLRSSIPHNVGANREAYVRNHYSGAQ